MARDGSRHPTQSLHLDLDSPHAPRHMRAAGEHAAAIAELDELVDCVGVAERYLERHQPAGEFKGHRLGHAVVRHAEGRVVAEVGHAARLVTTAASTAACVRTA